MLNIYIYNILIYRLYNWNIYCNRSFLCFVQTIWIEKKNVHVGKITVHNTYKGYKSVQKYLLKFKILLMKGMLLNFFEELWMTFYPLKKGR